jgi:hypothetical protein
MDVLRPRACQSHLHPQCTHVDIFSGDTLLPPSCILYVLENLVTLLFSGVGTPRQTVKHCQMMLYMQVSILENKHLPWAELQCWDATMLAKWMSDFHWWNVGCSAMMLD